MRRTTLLPVLAIAALSLAACGSDSDSGSGSSAPMLPTAPLDETTASAVDGAARRLVDESDGEIPAVWVGVWDGEAGAHTFAYGEAAPGRDAALEDTWRIGSISKTFTATVILQLVDEGKLALGDTVADIDPEIAGRFPAFADITLRQLLAMRSGVSDYLNTPKGIAPDVVADPQRVWTADELIARGIEVGVKRPGTPGYSTTNYIVLQEIAESIGGAPLRELIANRIASPLGLEATLLPPDDDTALTDPGTSGTIATACAEELEEDGAEAPVGTDTTDWNASYGQGGGGMQSSLEELGVWAASGLGDDLLTPATTSARTAGGASIGDGVTYGLGLQVVGDFLGHGGEAFGWQALALHDPAGDRTVVVAVNACGAGLGPYAIAAAAFPDAGIEESIFGG